MTFITELAAILQTTEKFALTRANAVGSLPPCDRCGGDGRYSFNGSHSICYKCDGKRSVAPRTKSEQVATLEDAAKAVTDGRLDRYKLSLEAANRVKNAEKIVMAAWQNTGVSKAYDWNRAYGTAETNTKFNQRDADIAAINKRMCVAYEHITAAAVAFRKETTKGDRTTAILTLDTALADALNAIEKADKQLKEYIAKH